MFEEDEVEVKEEEPKIDKKYKVLFWGQEQFDAIQDIPNIETKKMSVAVAKDFCVNRRHPALVLMDEDYVVYESRNGTITSSQELKAIIKFHNRGLKGKKFLDIFLTQEMIKDISKRGGRVWS